MPKIKEYPGNRLSRNPPVQLCIRYLLAYRFQPGSDEKWRVVGSEEAPTEAFRHRVSTGPLY